MLEDKVEVTLHHTEQKEKKMENRRKKENYFRLSNIYKHEIQKEETNKTEVRKL